MINTGALIRIYDSDFFYMMAIGRIHLYFAVLTCALTRPTDLLFPQSPLQSIPWVEVLFCPGAAVPSCSSPHRSDSRHLQSAGAGVSVCTAEQREAWRKEAGTHRNISVAAFKINTPNSKQSQVNVWFYAILSGGSVWPRGNNEKKIACLKEELDILENSPNVS